MNKPTNLGSVNYEIGVIKDRLEKSPLFHLSLSSKELFHSNFWAWLFKINPVSALALFSQKKVSAGGKFKIEREKKNIDLTVSDDNFELKIENKIKDIPHVEQLEQYERKSVRDCQKISMVLVTLFPPEFPQGMPGHWQTLRYGDLAERLNGFTVTDEYDNAIVRDYRTMIAELHKLSELLPRDNAYNFFWSSKNRNENDLLKLLDEMRFGDVYKKYRSSQLANYLFTTIKKSFPAVDIIFGNYDIREQHVGGFVKIGNSFNHKEGTIDIKYVFPSGSSMDIQIERGEYRHFLRTRKSEEKAKKLMEIDFWFKCQPGKYRGGKEYRRYGNDLYQFDILPFGIGFEELANKVTDDLSNLLAKQHKLESTIGI